MLVEHNLVAVGVLQHEVGHAVAFWICLDDQPYTIRLELRLD